MPSPTGLPTVVIVGRPNVGKSTLFNAILGERRAITGDEPGITRDRIIGEAVHRRRRFTLIDTGGIVPADADFIPAQILRQARFALDQADHIIFLVDGRSEFTAADRDLALLLRKLSKPVTIAVNKIDDPKREILTSAVYELGFEHLVSISAEHKLGIHELLDRATEGFPAEPHPTPDEEEAPADEGPRPIRVAIIGRPNVGKSTLLNALVGHDRAIVSPVAGTTRDSVDETVTSEGREFTFIDTAGIRRKGKTHLMAEKLSVVMARRHIRRAHVALLLIDAVEGPVASDATIAGYAHEEGRALILCVNKWDLLPQAKREEYEQKVRDQFRFLEYAPVVFLSATERQGVRGLFRRIAKVYASFDTRVPTGELNRFAEAMTIEPDRRLYFITQPSVRPPTFVLFMDTAKPLHFSAERYVINRIRQRFGFEGTPIVIKAKGRHAKRA